MLIGLMMMAATLVLPVGEVGEVFETGARRNPGRIVPVASVKVQPQVSGEILSVDFKNGQAVEKGAVLYRLDPVQYVAAEKNAAAKVAECKSTAEYATVTATRYETLVKTRAVSQDDLDRARSVRDAAQASLAAAEADLVAARDDLRHCTIVAPIAGRLGSTALTAGNYVQKGGRELVTLVQTDPIRVRFQISSVDYAGTFGADAGRIVAEGRVIAEGTAAGTVTGRVEYVENVADSATDTVEVYALLDNAAGTLLSGQTVMVTLSNARGTARAAVPPNAIAQDIRGTYVWVLDAENRAQMRRVVRGPLQGGLQTVREGLVKGERIVTDGVHRVRAGMTVTAEVAK